jgi:AcrR family transcriptional regulator
VVNRPERPRRSAPRSGPRSRDAERRPGGPPGARRLPAEARRAAILAAALPLFAARGLDGTTTRDLARAAGVTEPVLYRHFPSKDDLFAAVLDAGVARLLEALSRAIDGAADARSRLLALADRLPALLAERGDELRVLNGVAATRASGPAASRVRAAYARLGAFLAGALSAGGLRRGVDPTTAGHLLLQIGLGTTLTRSIGVPAIVRDGYGDAAVRLLLDALAERDGDADAR